MEERLRVFVAELDSQWGEIDKLHSSVDNKSALLKSDLKNEDLTNSLAYKLHNLYSAYEDLFKLIARFFENQIQDLAGYHSGLINRMKIHIEGVRPSLLSEESFKIIDELRGFRHVFRHAYSYELDAERVLKLSEKTIHLRDVFETEYELFRRRIKS
jgi:hypothetical protein